MLRVAIVVVVLFASSVATAQPRVLVRSESRIELRTTRSGGGVVVEGALRDDLGAPLGDREVRISLAPITSTTPLLHRALRTAGDGSFRLELSVTTGDYRLNASFAGDRMHQDVEVERRLDLDRADVRLRVEVPEGGRLDLDIARHLVLVRAHSTRGGHRLAIQVFDEGERPLASGVTDASGSVRFELESSQLGALGAGRLMVRSTADFTRAEAQTEVPIVRFRNTVLTLSADRAHIDSGESVTLSGELRISGGPLPGRAVGLFVEAEEPQHLATSLTGEDGRFERTVQLEADPGDIVIIARFESDAPGRASTRSPSVTIDVEGAPSAPWLWLLLPFLSCVALLVVIARRAPPAPERATAPPPPPPTGVLAGARVVRRPERMDVGGRVLSHGTEEPLYIGKAALRGAAGTEQCKLDAKGRFRFESVPPGRYVLTVTSRGHVPVESALEVPHRGEWSAMVVRLESMRSRALAPFRRVALGILRSTSKWPIRTNREVLEIAAGGAEPAPPLDELTGRVEDACYGPEPPDQGDVEAIDRLAREVDAR